jgi:hypothetical protein
MEAGWLAAYADLESLRAETPEIAKMIDAEGLPLEMVVFIDGRVALITLEDYEEGSERPLVRRFRLFPEFGQALPENRDGKEHEVRYMVIGCHGQLRLWSTKKWT